jgi:hypothetical protein
LELDEQNVTPITLEHLSDRFYCRISELFGEDWNEERGLQKRVNRLAFSQWFWAVFRGQL